MSKLFITLAGTAVATAGLLAIPAPAVAQQDSVAEIIVYGNDPCPRSTDDQVVVCARRPESERFRIPPKMRPGGTRQQTQAWAERSKALETVGSTGINSCSPVGPAGYTGCLQKVIQQARQEQKEASQSNTPPQD